MKKGWSRVFGAGLVVAVAGVVATASSPAQAGNECAPSFSITNETGGTIKITKVKYRVVRTGDFFTEDLGNKNVGKGSSASWGSQRLGKAGIGEALEFQVVYEDGFNKQFTTGTQGTSGVCGNSKTYSLKVR